MAETHEFGRDAERTARRYLQSIGYTIVLQRYRVPRGEIDLIALDGDQLVLVEVKARRHVLAQPELSVGAKKRAAIVRAAHAYLNEIGEPERGFRLDVIAIAGEEIRHVQDLFAD